MSDGSDLHVDQGSTEIRRIIEIFGLDSLSEVRFRCTGCGICCGTPPAVFIDEIITQADNFILGAQLRIISKIDPDDPRDIKIMRKTYPELDLSDPDARMTLADHLNKIASTQGVEIEEPITDGSGPCLAFSLIDVDQLSGRCPRLQPDGLCGIYETRPRKCRVVPLDESVPEELLGSSLSEEIIKMVSAGGKCEFANEAPVIWKDGSLTSDQDREIHGASGAGMSDGVGNISKALIGEYLEFKASENESSENTVANVVEHLGIEGQRPVFALIPAIARLTMIGALKRDQGAHILLVQADLIDDRLPSIDPDAAIEGVFGAKMKVVLSDWRDMYRFIGNAWLSQGNG
jgi:Fe-S-cluster containining protein